MEKPKMATVENPSLLYRFLVAMHKEVEGLKVQNIRTRIETLVKLVAVQQETAQAQVKLIEQLTTRVEELAATVEKLKHLDKLTAALAETGPTDKTGE